MRLALHPARRPTTPGDDQSPKRQRGVVGKIDFAHRPSLALRVLFPARKNGHAPEASRRALSLAEAAVSIVIVGAIMIGALQSLQGALRSRAIQAAQTNGPGIARRLMTEILQGAYEEPQTKTVTTTLSGRLDPLLATLASVVDLVAVTPPAFGPEAGESTGTRANFDDVDDYHGWSESPPQNREGGALANYTGWTLDVTVEFVAPGALAGAAVGTDQGVKRITVAVRDNRQRRWTLTAIRAQAAYAGSGSSAEETRLSWVGLELQIGPKADARIVGGAQLPNRAQSGL